MGFCESVVKYILFFANLLFALAGLALIGLGVAAKLRLKDVLEIFKVSPIIQQLPIGAIVIGCIVFIVAFFGCCGAIRESNCMLITYSLFMIILMVLKITLAVLIFVKKNEVLAAIPGWLKKGFESDQTAFHIIERLFKCCGPTGRTFYSVLPETCCASTPCGDSNAYIVGCDITFKYLFEYFGVTIGAVAIVVGAIELVAAVFGLCLANHARNKNSCTRY